VHQPVLLREVIDALRVRRNGVYVDATIGRGGHSRALLEQLAVDGRLLLIDQDPEAVRWAFEQFGDDRRVDIEQGNFVRLSEYLQRRQLMGRVDGLLFDLGVSSPQLDRPERGFSFRKDAPLDMRMDPGSGYSAADWLAEATESQMAEVLRRFGEERFARRIARAICIAREHGKIERTGQLRDIVARAVPKWEKGKDPATRTFQAIRIHVNDELAALRQALPQAVSALSPGGRLVVISFHSLEDRIVKRFMRDAARGDAFPADVPIRSNALNPQLRIVGKAVRPSADEILDNPRARSAVMRVAERT